MASSHKLFLAAEREKHFPSLSRDLYEVTSEETVDYNCIAFAAGEEHRCWWPDLGGQYYWPNDVPRDETVEAFSDMFESLGYRKCEHDRFEFLFEKVAIYRTRCGSPLALPKSPTHAARQLNSGVWKSKLGSWEDIEHSNLECLGGEDITGTITPYGEPVQILKRRLSLSVAIFWLLRIAWRRSGMEHLANRVFKADTA